MLGVFNLLRIYVVTQHLTGGTNGVSDSRCGDSQIKARCHEALKSNPGDKLRTKEILNDKSNHCIEDDRCYNSAG